MKRIPKIFALLAATALVIAAANTALAGKNPPSKPPPGKQGQSSKTGGSALPKQPPKALSSTKPQPPPTSPMTNTPTPSSDPAGQHWTSQRNLDTHFGKHAVQYPGLSKDQYGNHIASVPTLPGTLTHTLQDGREIHYHDGSGTFAVTNQADKVIAGYVPGNGTFTSQKGLDHFHKQIKKDLGIDQNKKLSTERPDIISSLPTNGRQRN
jgi:hypothetical protein